MDIAIDFDGTCVTHAYPAVGDDIGAEVTLRALVENGHNLILWTMRSGKALGSAVGWFTAKQIPLFGIQRNPTQDAWTTSPKCYAHMYIDDAALGCPLVYPEDRTRPYVDWVAVTRLLIAQNIIQPNDYA
jgi:hypothetical protein